MERLGIIPEYGLAVKPALEKSTQSKCPAMALIMQDGNVITGKTTDVLTASSALILNCIKTLAELPETICTLFHPSCCSPC